MGVAQALEATLLTKNQSESNVGGPQARRGETQADTLPQRRKSSKGQSETYPGSQPNARAQSAWGGFRLILLSSPLIQAQGPLAGHRDTAKAPDSETV